jgi:GNAT superfamily N-acetyltransferase
LWQSRGVGTALLERLLLAARNRRIKRLQMICLAENRRVRRLALKFDAELSSQYGSVVGEMKTPRPTPWRKAIPQARSVFRSITSTGL